MISAETSHILLFACYALTVGFLAIFGLHRYTILWLYRRHRLHPVLPPSLFPEDHLPHVTIQLPIFNELYVTRRLVESVALLDYPAHLLQIQILDDSTDETSDLARSLAEQFHAQGLDISHHHRSNRQGYKAGALEAGLATAKGEFICILDADFVPPPDLLRRTIHHFTDPRVGMVQTRWGHLNREHSLLTQLQAIFLDGHLLLEQTARSRSGRFFNFNGTAGLWRRSCITEAGGWEHDTLTEDMDLSYRAQLAGWKFIFLPEVVTPAELPINMNGFKSQQHRWTKGSVQTCLKLLPRIWRAPLPLRIKTEATFHLTANFAYLLTLALVLLLHPAIQSSLAWNGPWRWLLFDLPVFATASLSAAIYYLHAQTELRTRPLWHNLCLLPLLLSLGIGLSVSNAKAVLEALLGHRSEFTRTPKYGDSPASAPADWRKSRYLPVKTLVTLLEFTLALYFTYLCLDSLQRHAWASLPFLLMFTFGFSYVAVSSAAQWLPRKAEG